MERQKVDVPMAVDSNDSGQDSGHLVNPFMRVTKIHDEAFIWLH